MRDLSGFMNFPPSSPGLEGWPNEPAAPGEEGQGLGHSVNAALAQGDQSFPCRSKSEVGITWNWRTVPDAYRKESRMIEEEPERGTRKVGKVEDEGSKRALVEHLTPPNSPKKVGQPEAQILPHGVWGPNEDAPVFLQNTMDL